MEFTVSANALPKKSLTWTNVGYNHVDHRGGLTLKYDPSTGAVTETLDGHLISGNLEFIGFSGEKSLIMQVDGKLYGFTRSPGEIFDVLSIREDVTVEVPYQNEGEILDVIDKESLPESLHSSLIRCTLDVAEWSNYNSLVSGKLEFIGWARERFIMQVDGQVYDLTVVPSPEELFSVLIDEEVVRRTLSTRCGAYSAAQDCLPGNEIWNSVVDAFRREAARLNYEISDEDVQKVQQNVLKAIATAFKFHFRVELDETIQEVLDRKSEAAKEAAEREIQWRLRGIAWQPQSRSGLRIADLLFSDELNPGGEIWTAVEMAYHGLTRKAIPSGDVHAAVNEAIDMVLIGEIEALPFFIQHSCHKS
jgi:hypothetical protein